MFHIDEKYSGKEKRNTIGFFKGKELERQKLRKKLHPVSRDLDNYFHHKLHKRGWWPNGLFLRKQYYYYAKPGLGCFYEKNNVEQLKDLRELKKETKKNLLKNFIEYNFLEDNQYVITIEYCSNCEEHKTHTFHRAEMYKNYAISLQKCILLRFPFIKVILKPIETDILKEEHYKLPKVDLFGNSEKKYVNDKFKDVRIGAFEIQICFKKVGNEVQKALLHSKLQTKQFPEITKILDKIVSFLPNFTAQIIAYEKEEDIENSKKNNLDEVYKKGLLEGLQINIYLLNNIRVTNIATEAWNDIQTQQDPHKRSLMIKEQKLLNKEYMFKNNSILTNTNKVRPLSSITGYKSGKLRKSQSAQNILECEPELPDFLSDISKDLIMSILNPDPEKRITIEEIKQHPFYLKGKRLCNIDYSLKEQEILKTKEYFFKHVNDDDKNNNDDSIKENVIYLNKNNSEKMNKISSKNYKVNKTDGNIKSNEKNSVDVLSSNKYKFTINAESRNNNNLATIDNLNKLTRAKLQILSLKTKNIPKNDLNSFKRKFNPINLHIKKKLNTKIQNIINTEANENTKHGLPFIGQKEKDNMFSYLLSNKLKFKLDNSSNNSINLIKNSEENTNINNNKIKYIQNQSNKINHIILDKKMNNNDILENIKKNLANNNIGISSNKDIKLSDIHKTKMKSSEKIKRNINLHLNNIANNILF